MFNRVSHQGAQESVFVTGFLNYSGGESEEEPLDNYNYNSMIL